MNRKIFVISIIAFALDQVIKAIIGTIMTVNQTIPIIRDFFHITHFHNYGAAWGLFPNRQLFIIIATILALALIYRYMHSFKPNVRNNIAFGLLTGGILGNLLDRILHGYVIDFIDIYIFKYDFPIFNVGDICIVCGVILLIIAIIKGEDKLEKNSSNK